MARYPPGVFQANAPWRRSVIPGRWPPSPASDLGTPPWTDAAHRVDRVLGVHLVLVVHEHDRNAVLVGERLLAGRPKRGKSWLLLHAAIAVARGSYTLGDVQCVQGDVFYAALEDNKRRLQSRMTKLLPAFAQEWPERLHFETEMPRLKDGGLDMVRRWIEQANEPRLVIIDTLQKVRDPKGIDQNSYEADYAAVSELKACLGPRC